MSSISLYTRTRNIQRQILITYIKEVLNLVHKEYHKPKRKKIRFKVYRYKAPKRKPNVHVLRRNTKHFVGIADWVWDDNLMTIHLKKNKTIRCLTISVLHEYCHYTQNANKYYEYLKEYGYWKNPYEIQAEKFARANMERAFEECRWVLE
jgi:nucleoside-specific outer membrane channel protein Tsx